MDKVVTGGAGGSDAGRLGHGLGMQLTEGMSLIAADQTVLAAGLRSDLPKKQRLALFSGQSLRAAQA